MTHLAYIYHVMQFSDLISRNESFCCGLIILIVGQLSDLCRKMKLYVMIFLNGYLLVTEIYANIE